MFSNSLVLQTRFATLDQQYCWDVSRHQSSSQHPSSRGFSAGRWLCLSALFAVVRGQLFPAQLELSSLNGTTGFVINGDQTYDESGFSVSGAGDVNGDGFADLLIGAPFADPTSGLQDAGKTYLVFGRANLGSGGALELSTLGGSNGFTLNGDKRSDESGFSVSSAGDLNGDGFGDFLIGAHNADPGKRNDAGKTYVVFGKSGPSSDTVELSALSGTRGFTINGDHARDQSSLSISYAGDVNGDGISDLLIGAPYATHKGRTGVGMTYVVFGRPNLGSEGNLKLSSLDDNNGFILIGDQMGDQSGFSVSSAGDVNKDGISDLLIGARNADPSGRTSAGKVYVVFGRSGIGKGGVLELASLNHTTGVVLNGDQMNSQSGSSVSCAGDVNADGIADLLVGAYYATATTGLTKAGKSYVVFGKPDLGGVIELASLNGKDGFILNGRGEGEFGEESGKSVSSAGDVNGDGIADLLIGAWLGKPSSGRIQSGKVYVVFGKKGIGSDGSLELSTLDGTNGFILHGEKNYDRSGVSVSNAGDVNGDGIADLIIGAYRANPSSSRRNAGKTYVVFGRKAAVFPESASISSGLTNPSRSSFFPLSSTISSRRVKTFHSVVSADSTTSRDTTGYLTFEENSIVLPLAISGGVGLMASAIAAAILALKCRRSQQSIGKEMTAHNPPDAVQLQTKDYFINTASDTVQIAHAPSNIYDNMPAPPIAYGESSFYVSDE